MLNDMKLRAVLLVTLLLNTQYMSASAVGDPDQAVPPPSERPEKPSVSLDPIVNVSGGQQRQRQLLSQTLKIFRTRGLALPDLEIVFASTASECFGHDGFFSRKSVPWTVTICVDIPYVIAHELAHAWLAASLTKHDQDTYVEYRGLETWSSRDYPWIERGTEDAAFMMQQVLTVPGDPASDLWAERFAAVKLLLQLAQNHEHNVR